MNAHAQNALGFSLPFPTVEKWPPDYTSVFRWRQQRLLMMRNDPNALLGAKRYYKTHPVEFIEHWLTTYDPRNAGTGKLTYLPFVLFDRQKEMVNWLWQCLLLETPGLAEKCRDMGATWLCCGFSEWLWLFVDGSSVGWGSRKQDLVDTIGDPDSIFEKIRILIRNTPSVFYPRGFDLDQHMPFMRVVNPETGAAITGESGDNIGRGGRKLIYFKDESAHYERPEKIEAALSENTRVPIDISSVNGMGNVFHRKRKAGEDWNKWVFPTKGKTSVFIMDWRDHPEKDLAWYEAKRQKAESEGLLHLFAQEIDRDYAASLEGVIIKAHWVQAAIGAAEKLGFSDDGPQVGGQDVADGGGDLDALTIRKGPVCKLAENWSAPDQGVSARRAVSSAKEFLRYGPIEINYDSIGVGAGIKTETNRLKEQQLLPKGIKFVPWAASAKVLYPDARLIPHDKNSPINKDFFQNLKSQAWWMSARRFEKTYKAVVQGEIYDPGELVSISADLPMLHKLVEELSQATMSLSASTMKMVVNKAPEGTRSPNLADSFVIAYWPINSGANRYSWKALG